MRPFADRLKRAFVAGAMLVVPVGVLALLVMQGAQLPQKVTGPLARAFDLHSAVASAAALLLAVLLLAGATVLIGFAAGSALAGGALAALQSRVLRRVPGYELIGRVLSGFAWERAERGAALVELYRPGAAVFCLIMERLPDGRVFVFAPSSPAMTVGSVHVVAPELVTELDAGELGVARIAASWGVGASEALTEPARATASTPAV